MKEKNKKIRYSDGSIINGNWNLQFGCIIF